MPQNFYYLFKPRRTHIFLENDWIKFFKKYITSKKDFQTLWKTIAFQMFNILLKDNTLKIPYIGRIDIVVKRPKRYVKLRNEKPYWLYPKSEIVFTPDSELKKIFHKKFLGMHEIRELEDGTFDWMAKSDDNVTYERPI